MLTNAWEHAWPQCRPIGRQLRHCAPDRWVRFHSLPESKRYADSGDEYAELLHRHNTLIGELSGTASRTESLLVVTCSWSVGAAVAPREKGLAAAAPDSTYWHSVLRDVDGNEEFWNHLFVGTTRWRVGALDALLRLVADDDTADVIVAEPTFEWLYLPYDGGSDVLAASTAERDLLRERHSIWLSNHPMGL